MKERRKHKRLTERMVVAYKLPKEAKIEQITSSEDLSFGGIRIIIPKNVIKGDVLSLDINVLSDAIPILAKGEVIWVRKVTSKMVKRDKKKNENEFIVGIKFNKFERFDDERVKKYLGRKLQDNDD